jgi:hypothetical protein
MEKIAKRFLLFVFISAIPLILVTSVWLLTVGYFNWFDAVHSEPHGVFTSFAVFFAFFVSLLIPDYDL